MSGVDRFLTPHKIGGSQEPDPPQNMGGQVPDQVGQEPDPSKIRVTRNLTRMVSNQTREDMPWVA